MGTAAGTEVEKVSGLDKLNWMSGSWVGQDNGSNTELILSGTEGGIILGSFKKLSSNGELRFARFMNFQSTDGGEVVLRLYPFFRPRDDYYVSIEIGDNRTVFHRVYPKDSGCNITSVEEVLSDTGDKLKCDRHPVRVIYQRLPNGEFQETYLGYKYYDGVHHDVSFTRAYQKK
jgi:hypothetical protein